VLINHPANNINRNARQSCNERAVKSALVWLVLTLGLIGFDQLVKYWAKRFLSEAAEPRSILYLKPFYNNHFTFGLPVPEWLAYLIYIAALGLIGREIYWRGAVYHTSQRLAWTFIAGGALSNFLERLYFGRVFDFIGVFSGIFNPADALIIFGVVVLLWNLVFNDQGGQDYGGKNRFRSSHWTRRRNY
jgi:lipoprotein signal peptidase